MSDLQCAATLLVARHGEAEYETALLSDAGGSLTAQGREQSRALGSRLRERHVSCVYCSPLARAVQTAELAAGVLGVGVGVREDLRELSVGAYAGRPEQPDPFAETFAAWRDGDLEATYPGGEPAVDVVRRMREALESVADLHRGETVLVISHGGVLALTLPRLLSNLRNDHGHGNAPASCEPVEIAVDADDWTCVRWP